MREIFSFIFDKIIDPLTLPIHPLYEWLILGVIGLIAYVVAYRTVGNMYRSGDIDGRFFGSLFHWIIRAVVFFVIWFIIYWAIVIGQWISTHIALTLGILGGVIIIGITAYFLISHIIKETRT